MAYVITEPCIKCKHTDCVIQCPVVCFHEGANFLVIDPDDCIDCGACVDHCPVHAIYPEDQVPPQWRHYTALNAQYARAWPEITKPKPPMESAAEFAAVQDKAALLDPTPGSGDAH